MNYCEIDEENKPRIMTLIDFLYKDVISACGDGDALWYSYFYDVKDILKLVEEYNSQLLHKWEIRVYDDHINWGHEQEGIIITNNEELFNNAPSWQQVLIRY